MSNQMKIVVEAELENKEAMKKHIQNVKNMQTKTNKVLLELDRDSAILLANAAMNLMIHEGTMYGKENNRFQSIFHNFVKDTMHFNLQLYTAEDMYRTQKKIKRASVEVLRQCKKHATLQATL